MDDEPMWVADHVVAPTPSSAITIPETANEFAIKEIPKMSCSPDDVSPITHCSLDPAPQEIHSLFLNMKNASLTVLASCEGK
ncbi:hypothetical protein Tco_0099859 [Tanacetum coccineum]